MYGAVSFVGRASFIIKVEDIEKAKTTIFDDVESIELIKKDGSKVEITEVDWVLIDEVTRGNVTQGNIDDFENMKKSNT